MKNNINIREYHPKDCSEILKLFYYTVHTINAKDYSSKLLAVWATGNEDINAWNERFLNSYTFVAEINGVIVGFSNIDNNSYLDMLYVHKDYQRKGIASMLYKSIETKAIFKGYKEITTHASITAKQFFEKQNFIVTNENKVLRQNIELTNYIMIKQIIT